MVAALRYHEMEYFLMLQEAAGVKADSPRCAVVVSGRLFAYAQCVSVTVPM
jgi:hypothetical protein